MTTGRRTRLQHPCLMTMIEVAYQLREHAQVTQAHGDVIVVRYADDFIVGFEHRAEAERFLAELRERLAAVTRAMSPGSGCDG